MPLPGISTGPLQLPWQNHDKTDASGRQWQHQRQDEEGDSPGSWQGEGGRPESQEAVKAHFQKILHGIAHAKT